MHEESGYVPKNHQKTPSKEIGRQVFQLLRFFHNGVMAHIITPKAPMDHRYHHFTNQRGEHISGAIFSNQ